MIKTSKRASWHKKIARSSRLILHCCWLANIALNSLGVASNERTPLTWNDIMRLTKLCSPILQHVLAILISMSVCGVQIQIFSLAVLSLSITVLGYIRSNENLWIVAITDYRRPCRWQLWRLQIRFHPIRNNPAVTTHDQPLHAQHRGHDVPPDVCCAESTFGPANRNSSY
jgi:hypothetical protein